MRNALNYLRTEGVFSRVMATDSDYAVLPYQHPLVDMERCITRLIVLEWGINDMDLRPLVPDMVDPDTVRAFMVDTIRTLVDAARDLDEVSLRDAYEWLTAYGVRVPTCAVIAIESVDWLISKETQSDVVVTWYAYRCALVVLAYGVEELTLDDCFVINAIRAHAPETTLAYHLVEYARTGANLLHPYVSDRLRSRLVETGR